MTCADGGHTPRREACVWWKLPRPACDEALAGFGVFQRALACAVPGLQARLLRRVDDPAAATATLMETYALPSRPGGLGDGLLERLRTEGDAASAAWRVGERHFEIFTEAPPR